MNRLRLPRPWLILLLAVLLPLRGALAMALPCAPAATAAATAQAHASHHEARAMEQAHADCHGSLAAPTVEPGPDDAHAAHQGCTHCAAFCTLTPLADSGSAAADPPALPAAAFPPLAIAAARFERDGPERPPRSR
ncbi:hypothetical protein [Pseudorhodoferax sp.]|uniref:hypothetical protein n=1 Tax=Pseudorhodoferax sp. TaxID=1993553 RepID=UPI0039E4507F